MIKLLDFSNWNEYEGASEGSGRSEKIWLAAPDEQSIGLFKFPKPSDAEKTGITSEHISEHIAYQLGLLLGIPTARIDIGYYLGRIGCMSYLIPSPQESIKEGIEFISGLFPAYSRALIPII